MIEKTYRQFLGTLANENRIEIILALKKKSMNVSELMEELKMQQTTISHNLKRLQICGFVSFKQEGKFRKYSVNRETIIPLIELIEKHMNQYCCHIVEDDNISKKYKTTRLK
jgi:DNA-binding transcriptional ArsR family regulator